MRGVTAPGNEEIRRTSHFDGGKKCDKVKSRKKPTNIHKKRCGKLEKGLEGIGPQLPCIRRGIKLSLVGLLSEYDMTRKGYHLVSVRVRCDKAAGNSCLQSRDSRWMPRAKTSRQQCREDVDFAVTKVECLVGDAVSV